MAGIFYTEGRGEGQKLVNAAKDRVLVFDTLEELEAALPNLEPGQIVATKESDD